MQGIHQNVNRNQIKNPGSQVNELTVAIFTENEVEIDRLIREGVPVNEVALIKAINTRNINIFEKLIKAGGKPTPYILDLAINTCITGFVKAVVDVAPMLTDSLERACFTNNNEIIMAFLDGGALISPEVIEWSKLPDTSPEIANAITRRLEHLEDVEKNAKVLAQLATDGRSNFSKLSPEMLVMISSLMGMEENKIRHDKVAYDVAYQNFDLS